MEGWMDGWMDGWTDVRTNPNDRGCTTLVDWWALWMMDE